MELSFSGEIWYWRGPSPFHFVTVPEDVAADLHAVSSQVTYGWGMIPVTLTVGSTTRTTSLFPKDGGYIVPLRADLRAAEGIEVGDTVDIRMSVGG